MVDVAHFYMDFICSESCGKCSPCRIGTKRLLEMLTKVTNGNGTEQTLQDMPCTAKKYEEKRPQNAAVEHLPDVDAVLTTRELAVMIKRAGLIWDNLPDEKFDDDLIGEYSGASVIFGVTGGVMEAALRTAYHTLNGKERDPIEFKAVRGLEAVKEAEVDMGKAGKVKVAVTSGMANAKPLLDQVRAGTSPYAFIEIMIISIYGFPTMIGGQTYNRDPARLAAQVVTGIGFLGAGTIVQTGTDVKGLTTATTIWVVMAIGLACGSGNFIIAALATLLAYICLVMMRKVEKLLARRNPIVMPTSRAIRQRFSFAIKARQIKKEKKAAIGK